MYAMVYTTQFSEWLTAVLFQKGISQSELARQAGVTRGAINGLLTRLFRGIKIMGNGSVVPVLRN